MYEYHYWTVTVEFVGPIPTIIFSIAKEITRYAVTIPARSHPRTKAVVTLYGQKNFN